MLNEVPFPTEPEELSIPFQRRSPASDPKFAVQHRGLCQELLVSPCSSTYGLLEKSNYFPVEQLTPEMNISLKKDIAEIADGTLSSLSPK